MKKWVFVFFSLPWMLHAQNYSNLAGGRSAALAHSSVSFTDVWAAQHNQAGLGFLKKPTVAVSYENRYFLKDLALANAAFVYPSKVGNVGLSVNYFGFELYNQSKFGLNYARAFGKYFSLGLQLNYHSFYVEEGTVNQNAVTFEAGVLAKPIPKVQLGFHIFNPSNNYKNAETEERLPVIGRLGARYAFTDDVALSAEVKKSQDIAEQYALGFEYGLLKNILFRTGVGIRPLRNTFGFGLRFKDFSADMSYEYAYILGNNANISLQYSF